jgi:hypothetical protein
MTLLLKLLYLVIKNEKMPINEQMIWLKKKYMVFD